MVAASTIAVALIDGISSGMLLFLAASGLTLIFGVLGILNFAHGSFYMVGAYFMFFFVTDFVGDFWLSVVVAALLVGVFGVLIEVTIIRQIYRHDHIFQLILTFALVLVIDNGVRILWGTNFRSVGVPDLLAFRVEFLSRGVPAYNIFLIVTGIVVAASIWLAFDRTRIGRIVRAASENREAASAIGVNVPLMFTIVFFVGSVLAGLGGALATPYQSIHPAVGESIIIESFIVIILGGLGSFWGAFIGAMFIGIVNSLMFIVAPTLQPIVPYLVVAAVLLVRPGGLFGTEATI